jgi:hypothetical protein
MQLVPFDDSEFKRLQTYYELGYALEPEEIHVVQRYVVEQALSGIGSHELVVYDDLGSHVFPRKR